MYKDSLKNEKVLLIGLEFIEPLFSGNGILTQSIVRSLLDINYHVTVLCCRPQGTWHTEPQKFKHDIEQNKLKICSVEVPKEKWKRLDRLSCWDDFSKNIEDIDFNEVFDNYKNHKGFRYIFCVDWSAIPTYDKLIEMKKLHLPYRHILVNLVFRVFSSSKELLQDSEHTQFYQNLEASAVFKSQITIVLSDVDLKEINKVIENVETEKANNIQHLKALGKKFFIMVPPLREDIFTLASSSTPIPMKDRKFLMCNVRISPEKNALYFAQIIHKLYDRGVLQSYGIIPVLAGIVCDKQYARKVDEMLPKEVKVLREFLAHDEMMHYVSHSILLFHPPLYDAYGMTIAEAAAVGTPSMIHNENIGASCLFQEGEIFKGDYLCIDGIIDQVSHLITNSTLVEETGKRARKRSLRWTAKEYAESLQEKLSSSWI